MKDTLTKVVLKNDDELIIKIPTVSDVDNMIEYLNTIGGESNNLLFGAGEFNISKENEIEYINNMNFDNNSLIIIGIINNRVVSVAQISAEQRKRICHNCEVAISVKKEFWAQGIGTAMMKELITFAKKHPLIKNVSLGVRAGNDNAIKLYEKFGFKKIGVHKNFFNVSNTYYDEILMDLYLVK